VEAEISEARRKFLGRYGASATRLIINLWFFARAEGHLA
jgi:hypothetical protein